MDNLSHSKIFYKYLFKLSLKDEKGQSVFKKSFIIKGQPFSSTL